VLPPLEEYVEYLKRIWSNRWLTNDGELVKLLEGELKDYLGIKQLSLLSNGTLALQIALKALGLRGEVITTPFTFAATHRLRNPGEIDCAIEDASIPVSNCFTFPSGKVMLII